ncbi:thioesterase II family protein [Streptomyces sp. NPDC006463]|uniref:thioesterase II family protein n=1 Tax=Streptomyces sp. NPDC006463 TaxID=3364746 RepID=UPI0036B9CAE8
MSFSLLCLPFSGGGAGFFRPWGNLGVPGVEVVPLQLPGREERYAESPHFVLENAVADLASQAERLTADRRPIAIFGHSRFGAVLAFELARRLESRPQFDLIRLFVSGSPGPRVRPPRISDLADEDFLIRVEEMSGYRHAAFDHPQLRDLLLPLLRADTAIHEDYEPFSDAPLSTPITSVRGTHDVLAPRELAELWGAVTSKPFEILEMPGGHMYLTESSRVLLEKIVENCK